MFQSDLVRPACFSSPPAAGSEDPYSESENGQIASADYLLQKGREISVKTHTVPNKQIFT